MLTCPLCSSPLTRNGNTLQCEHMHTFDRAKEGYVNLVTRRLAATVGDTKEMIAARHHFLDAGFYQPLSDTLNHYAVSYLSTFFTLQGWHEVALLDVGCGEGYYGGRMQVYLQRQLANMHVSGVGLDISKEAIRMAARRYHNVQFVVANVNARLVFADESIHLLLNVFAPRNIAEFARVLVPGGIVLVAVPGSRHLHQLRTQLPMLSIQENKVQHVVEQFAPHFELLTASTLNYSLRLTREEVQQVVSMTPNYWHHSDTKLEGEMKEIVTEVEFVCLVFRKRMPIYPMQV